MNKDLIFVVLVFWVTMSAYVMHWHYKRGDLSIGTILLALMLGPILAFIIRDEIKETKRQQETEENENDRHRRYFRTLSEINRQGIPSFGRSIPPPPPISQNRRETFTFDELREARRREKGISKLKDFKFLKG